MFKTLVLFVLLAFASLASAQSAGDDIVVTPVKTAAAESSASDLLNSCKVTFPNGLTDTAKCREGLVAVIDPRDKLQCAPRTNLVKKGGYYYFLKNPKDAGERVNPCKNGDKVQS